jgi:5'(3')-deoxyribonucleotidase
MIFLDMDGVLADFVGAVFKMYKHKPVTKRHWKSGQGLDDILDVPMRDIVHEIKIRGRSFWFGLKPLPVGRKIATWLFQHQYKPVILSSPTDFPECVAWKIDWLNTHYPNLTERVWTDQKHLLAGTNRILIDDLSQNCRNWNGYGGSSVLVPQPWNQESRSPVKQLEELCTKC